MSSRFDRLVAQVVAQDRGFQRDLDNRHLAEIARLLGALPEPRPQNRVEHQRLVLLGWVVRQLRMSRAALGASNPRHTISLGGYAHPGIGLRDRLRRRGFRIVATAPRDAPAFRLTLSAPGVSDALLTPSNETASHQLAAAGLPVAESADVAYGYVDAVSAGPAPQDEDPGSWPEALVSAHPDAMWDFVQSEYGRPWRERLTSALDGSPVNDRWADRYRLVTGRSEHGFRSDLVRLRVDRRDSPDASPPRATRIRTLERRGALIEPVGPEVLVPAPNAAWFTLNDARLQDGATVTSQTDLIVFESAADPGYDLVSGTWQTLFGTSMSPDVALLKRHPSATATIPEGVLLSGRSDFNWYHWMVEYLPRVLNIPASISPRVPVIVSTRTPKSGIEALRALTDRPIVAVDPELSQHVGQLHFSAPVVQTPDSPRIPWIDGLRMDVATLASMRARFNVDKPDDSADRRVFLRRVSNHRSLINEPRLAAIARGRGFEVVDPAGMDFATQLELFSTTRVLVGASGAVMANYLFMRPGGHVLALTSNQLADFVLPAALANVSSLTFSYLTGAARHSREQLDLSSWLRSDFRIDADSFAQALGRW